MSTTHVEPMTAAQAHYAQWPAKMKAMREASPDIAQGFSGMFQRLMGEGALTVREKELLAIAIGLAIRCDPCVYAHVEKAAKLGVTRAQLMELAGVVVTMQGGPGYVSVPKLMDAMDALGVV